MPIITALKGHSNSECENNPSSCWVDVDLSKPEDHEWLVTQSGLSEELIAFLVRENFVNHRNLHDGSVLIALKVSGDQSTLNPLGLVDLKIFIDANRIITIRYHPVMAIEQTYAYLKNTPQNSVTHSGKVMDVFSHIVNNLIVHIEKITFTMSDRLAVLEDQYFDNGTVFDSAVLLKLRGDICKIRRILNVLRNTLLIRIEDAILPIDKEARVGMLRASNHVTLNIDNLDDLVSRIDTLQNLDNTNRAEAMSQSSFRLTIVATVFLPLTFVSGLLGMNVGGIPETDSPWGFWAITGGMVTLATGLWVYLYRRLQTARMKR